MSRNTIFSSFIKCLFALSLFQMTTIAVKAQEVSLGGFTGTLTTTAIWHGSREGNKMDRRCISVLSWNTWPTWYS